MAAQPIYPNELYLALDRMYTRLAGYIDTRIDILAAQMRIDRQESIARDNELRNSMKQLADATLTLTQQVSNVQNTQQSMQQQMTTIETTQQTMMQIIRDLHAEAMEAINELRPRGNE